VETPTFVPTVDLELWTIAEPARKQKRLDASMMRRLILVLCRGRFLTLGKWRSCSTGTRTAS
jgi:hypothetical protein